MIAHRLVHSPFLVLSILVVATVPAQGQVTSASTNRVSGSASAASRSAHHKQIQIVYNRGADSTRVSVVTHPGLYFVTWQRPRLTWSVTHAGQRAGDISPGQSVELEFRTQTPQVPTDNRLVLTYGPAGRLEATSIWANTVPGMITNSTYMHFWIPIDQLALVVASEQVELSVGGVRARFDAQQLEALRDLVSRVGPAPSPTDVGHG